MREIQTHVARELLRIPFRHKKKVSLFLGLAVVATLAALLLIPKTYRSEAKLFVRVGRESVALDPTAMTGQAVGLTDSREVEINSILEILRSRGLVEKVVDKLGPDQILDKTSESQSDSNVVSGFFAWVEKTFGQGSAVSDYERAVTKLQNDLSISSQRRTTVLEIGCDARSPELAQKIVATLLDVYTQEHARLNRTAGSFDFFEEQAVLLDKRLIDANEALRQAKNEGGLVSIDGQRTMLQTEMSKVEGDMIRSEHDLSGSQAKIKALTTALSKMPERLRGDEIRGVANASSDEMRKRLYDLELQVYDARSKLTDEHPAMKALNAQLAEARATAKGEDRNRTHLTEEVNPSRIPLLTALATEESEAAAGIARLATLTRQREVVLGRLKSLNEHETIIVQRQRQADQLETAYKSYVEKREMSRVDRALAQDRISNVNIAQSPTYVAKPILPSVPLILALGLVFAIGGALGVAWVAEYFDHTLKSPSEVEHALQASVLLTIPRTSYHRVMMN